MNGNLSRQRVADLINLDNRIPSVQEFYNLGTVDAAPKNVGELSNIRLLSTPILLMATTAVAKKERLGLPGRVSRIECRNRAIVAGYSEMRPLLPVSRSRISSCQVEQHGLSTDAATFRSFQGCGRRVSYRRRQSTILSLVTMTKLISLAS